MSKNPPKIYEKNIQTVYNHSQKELYDPETGEVVLVDNIVKTSANMKSFWKCYLMDFLAVLGIIDNKQLEVFIHVAENTKPSDNIFIGTYRKIAENTNTSVSTVQRIMKKLQENNFVRKIQNGVWFINPNILMKGSDTKRQILLSYYLDEENSTKIERIPNAKPLKPEINPSNSNEKLLGEPLFKEGKNHA